MSYPESSPLGKLYESQSVRKKNRARATPALQTPYCLSLKKSKTLKKIQYPLAFTTL